jgi:hypothetical protein
MNARHNFKYNTGTETGGVRGRPGGQLCELTQPQAKVRLQTAKVNRTIARECLH